MLKGDRPITPRTEAQVKALIDSLKEPAHHLT